MLSLREERDVYRTCQLKIKLAAPLGAKYAQGMIRFAPKGAPDDTLYGGFYKHLAPNGAKATAASAHQTA
jgi:hypothetical protein